MSSDNKPYNKYAELKENIYIINNNVYFSIQT